MGTASITLRLDAREKAIIQDYASTFGQSLSEFMRTAALQRIEDETDLQAWCERGPSSTPIRRCALRTRWPASTYELPAPVLPARRRPALQA